MPLCLLLFISTCGFSQLLQLERTWSELERNGVLDRPKTMAVQSSGDHYAVVYNHARTFDVVLYDRSTELIWRRSFSREDEKLPPKRQAIAVAFSALADGVFVLIREQREGVAYGNGRIIKYDMSGDRVLWHTGIYMRDYHPEVLLAASNGDAIVAGWDIDPTVGAPPTDHGRSPMYVARYHAWTGFDAWSSDAIYIGPAITAPLAIAQSLDYNMIYVTGTATRFGTIPYVSSGHPSKMFTVGINADDGNEVWRRQVSEDDPQPFSQRGHGYALQPLNDGVAVLGQVAGAGFPGSRFVGTVLVKYDLAGNPAWGLLRASALREYPQLVRNNLAADFGPSSGTPSRPVLSIAYPLAETANRSVVEKIRDDGTMGTSIWSHATWPDEEIWSLNCSRMPHGKLYLGVHIGAPFDQNQVQVFSADNILVANGPLRPGRRINQIELVPEPDYARIPSDTAVIFVSGNTNPDSSPRPVERDGLVERYELKDRAPFPGPFEEIDIFVSEIVSESSWRVEAFCNGVEPCVDVAIKAHAIQYGKTVWDKEFTKPTEITLSDTGIPTTYGLQLKVNKEYQEVITMDETLFSAGVRGVRIQTDTTQSLTIKSTTDGKKVPFTLSLLNSLGVTIKQYNLEAPDEIVITDKQVEQVARLLLTAPDPLQVNVYPNPSSGEFTVEGSTQKKSKMTVSVFTMDGHKIYHEQVPSGEKWLVKMPSAKPGLYVLLVKAGAYEHKQLIEIKY